MSPSSYKCSLLPTLWLVLIVFCPSVGAEGQPPQAETHGIFNASQPKEGLLAAGQPTQEQLEALAKAGFRSVIDLRTDSEDRGFDEASAARALGLSYQNLPVSGPALADDATYETFFHAMATAERPLLVHCASSNRVGALYLAYLAEVEGVPRPEALERARAAGLRAASLTATVEDALDRRLSPTTAILVRHAEKAHSGDDPPLTEAGRERALTLAHVLGETGVHAVYSTDFNRTRDTATPLAEKLGRELRLLEAGPDFGQVVAQLLRRQHRGETVVVASHSNTIPWILEALGLEPPEIGDDEYDDLFIVTISPEGAVRLLTLRYGHETP